MLGPNFAYIQVIFHFCLKAFDKMSRFFYCYNASLMLYFDGTQTTKFIQCSVILFSYTLRLTNRVVIY